MRGLFAGLIAAVLVLPGPTRAQAQGAGETLAPRGSSRSGVIQGRAVGIDLGKTLHIVIETDSGPVKLSALPTQIANLTRGDIVAFRYRDYGGELWIELDPPGTPGAPQISPESFGETGSVAGQITALDKSYGQIQVHGRTFRTHPQLLENLLPGEFVDVSYVQFGDTFGAVAIRPAGSSPPALGGSGTR